MFMSPIFRFASRLASRLANLYKLHKLKQLMLKTFTFLSANAHFICKYMSRFASAFSSRMKVNILTETVAEGHFCTTFFNTNL